METFVDGCAKNSTAIISDLKKILEKSHDFEGSVVATGSYGRLEATSGSDLDFYILREGADDKEEIKSIQSIISGYLDKKGIKVPASDGHFNESVLSSDIITEIGGNKDSNARITRRVLFITEGRCLFNERYFSGVKNQLIERYINDEISEHQLALFFLNDIIRFYRTMCVDFENKTTEGGKNWGIRNIKLVFSRKLLYFGGVVMAAETAQRTAKEKRISMIKLSDMSPIERIRSVFGDDSNRALDIYSEFLMAMDDNSIRSMLEETQISKNTHSEKFRYLKNLGQHLSYELISMLNKRYSQSHPIHKCLII